MDQHSSASTATGAAADPAGPTDEGDAPTSRPRKAAIRVLLLLVVVFLVAVWGYAFYAGSRPLPDALDDPEIAAQAEQICSVTVAELKDLPPAFEAESATARADVIERSDVELASMVDLLDALQPATPRDVAMWIEWVGDWRTYLGDRTGYVERLRADPMARFYVTEKDKDQVTEPIDRFARSNRMLSCATPQDLG